MNKSTISEQLKHDYPDYAIHLDSDSRMIVADNHKMTLLNTSSDLETMNIFSRYGRYFYQAITQLLSSNFDVLPEEGSYASTLIILKKDLNKYKVQKLAKEWGIGFLETGKEVLAVEVDDGIERNLLIENNVPYEEQKDEELLPELEGLPDDEESEELGKLEEIKFESEIKFLERGIEFAAAMEEVKDRDKDLRKEIEEFEEVEDLKNVDEKIQKSEKNNNKKGILNSILRILKL